MEGSNAPDHGTAEAIVYRRPVVTTICRADYAVSKRSCVDRSATVLGKTSDGVPVAKIPSVPKCSLAEADAREKEETEWKGKG